MSEGVREMTDYEVAESIIKIINDCDINSEFLFKWQIEFIEKLCRKQLHNEWIKTDKYNNMISAFQCDFSLAKNGEMILDTLDGILHNPKLNGELLKDIELLEELEYTLRSGKAEIHIKTDV